MAFQIFKILLVLIIGLIMSSIVQSMRFDLQSGTTKCITEDIKNSAMSVGKYTVISPNDAYPMPDTHKITVRVTSPYGNNYHYGDHVDAGTFAFTAAESGDYMACFLASDHKPLVTLSIEFEWKSGVAAKDWSKVAKKGQIEGWEKFNILRMVHEASFDLLKGQVESRFSVMELELKKLFDTVTSIHDEMFYLREREEEMQVLNKATNTKMATFSFLSLMVCLSVAGLQLWHLKTFFERKKLL